MMNFYHPHKFSQLLGNNIVCEKTIHNTNFFEKYYTFEHVLSLGNAQISKTNYEFLKKIYSAQTLDKFSLDNHIIDVFPKYLSKSLSTLVYIYLSRHSDKGMFIGSVDKIAYDFNQSKDHILIALAELEEFFLIKIEGNILLKISLNHNWSLGAHSL